jgi:hypothetical protein
MTGCGGENSRARCSIKRRDAARAIRPSTSHCDGSAHGKTTEQPLAGRGHQRFSTTRDAGVKVFAACPIRTTGRNPDPVGFLPAKDFPYTINQDTITESTA